VFYSHLNKQYDETLTRHWRELASELKDRMVDVDYPLNSKLEFPQVVAQVVSKKSCIRETLVKAYKHRQPMDVAALKDLQQDAERLWRLHRNLWLQRNKPNGLEVLEMRYGGLLTRLQSLQERIQDYSDGKIANIPEFDEDTQKIWTSDSLVVDYAHSVTPARNLGTG
jgi:hypothetical protein